MKAREKMAIKNMRFNRYFLLRYSLALFFFANLNWLVFMLPARNAAMLLPAAMLILAIFPIQEFIKLYSSSNAVQLSKTRLYYRSQLILNSVLIIVSLHNGFYSFAFPFLNANAYGTVGLISVLTLGAVISGLCIGKLNAIAENKDRGYKLFNNFRQSMKVSETYGE